MSRDAQLDKLAAADWAKMSYSEWEKNVLVLLELPLKEDEEKLIAKRRATLIKAFESLSPHVAAAVKPRVAKEAQRKDRFTNGFRNLSTELEGQLRTIVERHVAKLSAIAPIPPPQEDGRVAPTPPAPEREKSGHSTPRQRPSRPGTWELGGMMLDGIGAGIKDAVKNPQYLPGKFLLEFIPPAVIDPFLKDSHIMTVVTGTDDLPFLTQQGPPENALQRQADRIAKRWSGASRHVNFTFYRPVVSVAGAGTALSGSIRPTGTIRNRGGGAGGGPPIPPPSLVVRTVQKVTMKVMTFWEKVGGHTLQKHRPDIPDDVLLRRLFSDPDPDFMPYKIWVKRKANGQLITDKQTRSSRWLDEATMHKAIGELLERALPTIRDHIARGVPVPPLMAKMPYKTGVGWVKAGNSALFEDNLNGITMYIGRRKDHVPTAADPEGWYVISAFPTKFQ